MTDYLDSAAVVRARLTSSWFTSELLDSLAATARGFASRFPATDEGLFEITEEVRLSVVRLEDAIELRSDSVELENWMLFNVLNDMLRLILTRLWTIAPGERVSLLLARGSHVVESSIVLHAAVRHLVLSLPDSNLDVDLGSGGTAYLGTTGEEALEVDPISFESKAAPLQLDSCVTLPVYYATDRAPIGAADGSTTWFGGERGDLAFGIANVKVPLDRKIGALERRKRWYQAFHFDEDARTHIHTLHELDENAFYDSLSIAISKPERRRLLVFVHGYNVSFDAAAIRAAQLYTDLEFEGVPLLYSWPSADWTPLYFRDAATVEASRHTFAAIVQRLTSQVRADELHIIAHSMGSRAVARALEHLAVEMKDSCPLVTELIFAAPDVDAQEMANMLPQLHAIAKRVTIYGSSKDRAIRFSARIAGWRRAGDGGVNLLIHPQYAESIDASLVDTEFLAHSYMAENRTLLNDMNALIEHGHPAKRRHGVNVRGDGGYTFRGSYRP